MAISRIGAAIAEATTITIPGTYAAGDLIIIAAYRDGNATAPTLPASWMPIDNQGANTNSMRLGYKYAASGSETSGTWTNATELACIVYRGAGGVMSFANGTASSTSLAFNALTMWNTDGNSWVAGFVGHRSINTAITTAPTGMTNRAGANGATAGIAVHDTGAGVSSWSTQTVAAGGTASGWESYTLEIIPDTYFGIRQQQKATAGTAASLAITPQTTPVNGNLMLAFVAFANNVAAVTGPAGWTAIDNSSNAAGAGLSIWRKVASSESGAYTFTGSGASDSWSIYFCEIPGANTTTPVDGHSLSHLAASGTTYATPSVTPATLSDMAFLAFTQDLDSTTFTVNGTTTRVGDVHPGSNHGLGVAIKSAPTASTATAITQTWTGQASDTFVATLLIAKAAAGATVTPTTAALTLTGLTPTVTATNNITVTPGLATLALSLLTASVIINNIVTPGVASLAITPLAPVVSVSDSKTASPTPASLVLTGLTPTVTATANQTVTPTAAALVATGLAPTVTATDNKVATPSLAALTLTGLTPTVSVTNNKTATPTAATLTITGLTPTVSVTNNKTVTPTSAALVLTGLAPTVTATDNKTVTPTAASLVLSGLTPTVTVSGNKLVTPSLATLTLTGLAPTVTATANQTVTPSTLALTLTGLVPTVTSGSNQTVTPGTASLTVTGLTPTVSVTNNKTASPTPAALVLTGLAPTVTATDHKLVTPSTVALVITGLTPSVTATANQVVTPIRVVLTITGQLPTVTVATPSFGLTHLPRYKNHEGVIRRRTSSGGHLPRR